MTRQLVHATCVAVDGAGGPCAVLIRGSSGAGKSDLAMRMIDGGARLVSDDQCEVWRENGADGARVFARAPETIAGSMEVRGVGIVSVPAVPQAPVVLLVDLVAREAVERMPEEVTEDLLGLDLPRIALHAFEAGAPAKLRLVLLARAGFRAESSVPSPTDPHGHSGPKETSGMTVFVTSFSYRKGLPREADLVFDVRFLANPYYEEDLRALDGREPKVAAFIEADPAFAAFFNGLTGMLAPLLSRFEQEGKGHLTIAVGCTGGYHRSVAVTEKLAAWLGEQGQRVHASHRDIAPG